MNVPVMCLAEGQVHDLLQAVPCGRAWSTGRNLQVVLLVRNATGDEEVSAGGGRLRGVILAHSLPHLSHLGAGGFTASTAVSPRMYPEESIGVQHGPPCWHRNADTLLPLRSGVRARQERVPFVTCEDAQLLDSAVRPLLGKRVRLQAGTQGVLLAADDGTEASADGSSAHVDSAAATQHTSAKGAVTKARQRKLLQYDRLT
jgi:phosphoglucan, water dikinase